MAKAPREERMKALYESLVGGTYRPGSWKPDARNDIQQILYVEDVCKSILEIIGQMRSRNPNSEDATPANDLTEQMRSELHFLRSLVNDRQFLKSFEYLNRRGSWPPHGRLICD